MLLGDKRGEAGESDGGGQYGCIRGLGSECSRLAMGRWATGGVRKAGDDMTLSAVCGLRSAGVRCAYAEVYAELRIGGRRMDRLAQPVETGRGLLVLLVGGLGADAADGRLGGPDRGRG